MFVPEPQSLINFFSQNLRLLCFFEVCLSVFLLAVAHKGGPIPCFLIQSVSTFYISSCFLFLGTVRSKWIYQVYLGRAARSSSAHNLLINCSYLFQYMREVACEHSSFPWSHLSSPSLSFSSSFICPSFFGASRPFLLFGLAFLFSNSFFSRLLS